MSVRAYVVKKIDYGHETFNMWNDKEVVDKLRDGGYLDNLNDDGSGMFEVDVDTLKEILRIPGVDAGVKEMVRKDLSMAEKKGLDWVLYYAF